MITYVGSDLFQSPAKVLVNTVNTQGVMGKGLALQFKRIYPSMFKEYRDYCERGLFGIGRLHLYKTHHKWILNFATKEHWRKPSKVEYIEEGLQTFAREYARRGISSVAFPALGCGNGELDFDSQVKQLMEMYLKEVRIPVLIYPNGPRAGLPEHKDTGNIAEWLRSEPASLPFDEVWGDVMALLEHRNHFNTSVKENSYTVRVQKDPPSMTITSSGRVYNIRSDELLEFWQQLRDYGLTYRGIIPEHYRISYLIPVFEQLPYVQKISVSDSNLRLKTQPTVGLQVVPSPSNIEEAPGSLFGSAIHAI